MKRSLRIFLGLLVALLLVTSVYVAVKRHKSEELLRKAHTACLVIALKIQDVVPEISKYEFIDVFPPDTGGKSLGYEWEGNSYWCASNTVSRTYLHLWIKFDLEENNTVFYTDGFFPVALQKSMVTEKHPDADEYDWGHITVKMLWALERENIEKKQ